MASEKLSEIYFQTVGRFKYQSILENNESIQSTLRNLLELQSNFYSKNAGAGEPNVAELAENLRNFDASDAIKILTNSNEILSKFSKDFSEYSNENNLNDKKNEGSLIEIHSIRNISGEEYEVIVENRSDFTRENITLYMTIGEVLIPVATIRTLGKYSKVTLKIDIPLATFLNNGVSLISLREKEKEIASKVFNPLEIIEILSSEHGIQLKIKNNVGVKLRAIIFFNLEDPIKEIEIEPNSLILSLIQSIAGSFGILNGDVLISNEIQYP